LVVDYVSLPNHEVPVLRSSQDELSVAVLSSDIKLIKEGQHDTNRFDIPVNGKPYRVLEGILPE